MPAITPRTSLRVAAFACLLVLASCRSDSTDRSDVLYSHGRPRPTILDQPAPEYSAREAVSVQFALARTLEEEKNWKGAEQVYRRILERNPKHADAAHRLAILCDRQNRFKDSEKYFRLALKARPGDPNVFCDVGYSFYRQRRWADAEMNLKQATAINKSHARAHNHLGLLYAQLDRRNEALAEFKLAGCNASQAHTNVALVLSLNDRLDDAQQEYLAALNADPTSDEVRSRLQKIESVLAMTKPAVPRRAARKSPIRVVRHSVEAPKRITPIPSGAPAAVPKSPPKLPKVSAAPYPAAPKTQSPAVKSAAVGLPFPARPHPAPWEIEPWKPKAAPTPSPSPKGAVRLKSAATPAPKKRPANPVPSDRRKWPMDDFHPFDEPKPAAQSSNRPSLPTLPARWRKQPVRPSASPSVDDAFHPIENESARKSALEPIRPQGRRQRPVVESQGTRSAGDPGLIDVEAIVPLPSKGRGKAIVIE
jgi:tetratricopeptide (TPR) repeat protein